MLVYAVYSYLAESISVTRLEESMVTMVNKVAMDPETQHTLKMCAVTAADAISEQYNPLSKFMGLFTPALKDEMSYPDLVAKNLHLAMTILLILQIDLGTTLGTLFNAN